MNWWCLWRFTTMSWLITTTTSALLTPAMGTNKKPEDYYQPNKQLIKLRGAERFLSTIRYTAIPHLGYWQRWLFRERDCLGLIWFRESQLFVIRSSYFHHYLRDIYWYLGHEIRYYWCITLKWDAQSFIDTISLIADIRFDTRLSCFDDSLHGIDIMHIDSYSHAPGHLPIILKLFRYDRIYYFIYIGATRQNMKASAGHNAGRR